MMNRHVPLVPKDPTGPLRVIMIGRVSTPQQSLENIEASYAADEKFLRQYYDGPLHTKHLGEQGSGMRTDRATILEAEEEIATGTWDLVLMEDLSRAYRNPRHQHAFVQDAVDADTRVICIGDNLDTADPNWEVMIGAATLEFPTDGGRWLRSMRPLRTGLGFDSSRRSVYGSGCRTLRCIRRGSLELLLGSGTARDAPVLS